MTKKKPARRGPKPGIRLKPREACVTAGRRLGLFLLPPDHARLSAAAERRRVSVAALARELILAGLSDAT